MLTLVFSVAPRARRSPRSLGRPTPTSDADVRRRRRAAVDDLAEDDERADARSKGDFRVTSFADDGV